MHAQQVTLQKMTPAEYAAAAQSFLATTLPGYRRSSKLIVELRARMLFSARTSLCL